MFCLIAFYDNSENHFFLFYINHSTSTLYIRLSLHDPHASGFCHCGLDCVQIFIINAVFTQTVMALKLNDYCLHLEHFQTSGGSSPLCQQSRMCLLYRDSS